MIRLLIADDHPVVRAGLAGLFADEEGFEVVGEAIDGAAAIDIAAKERPDVVLMDLRMPVLDGVAATARIVALDAPAPRVLILTTYESDDQILAAIEAGAAGYLLKAAPQDEIVAGIRSVARGIRDSDAARDRGVAARGPGAQQQTHRCRSRNRRVDSEDPPAQGLREARGGRPHARRDRGHGARHSLAPLHPSGEPTPIGANPQVSRADRCGFGMEGVGSAEERDGAGSRDETECHV